MPMPNSGLLALDLHTTPSFKVSQQVPQMNLGVSFIYLFLNILFPLNREDMYAQDSIDLLQNSGLQFRKHEEDGIDPLEFAELLMSSGKLTLCVVAVPKEVVLANKS